ncbi:MAG: Na(+)-translocating NADH-quinone reductase subunit C [Pirellulales bacterium]
MVTRDSAAGTILIALILCVVCSVVVAGTAVGLRPTQRANRELDQKKNVLIAGGLYEAGDAKDEIEEKFETVRRVLIDLDTGEPVPEEVLEAENIDPATYDPVKAAKNTRLNKKIPAGALPGILTRAKYNFVFEVMEGGEVQQYIFPIYGNGLWSTMYGYLALDKDLTTVRGITYYQDGETPGLGGEINNSRWQASWRGKQLYGPGGDVQLEVIKGSAPDGADDKIDGLSGATITANGVTDTLDYWFGPEGFEPFIAKQRQNAAGGTDG